MKKISLMILSLFLMSLSVLEAENNIPKIANNYSQRFETRFVQQVFYGGFYFHIADYIDGTRVITCLDGPDKGLQAVTYNGIYQTETRAVQWNKDHFVHFYQHGRIISYPTLQISELY